MDLIMCLESVHPFLMLKLESSVLAQWQKFVELWIFYIGIPRDLVYMGVSVDRASWPLPSTFPWEHMLFERGVWNLVGHKY